MKLIAEQIIPEVAETSAVVLHTLFEVKPGETVEELMKRLRLTGQLSWHFEAEVRLKIVKPC